MRTYQRSVDAFDEAAAIYLGVNRTDMRCLDVLLEQGQATPGYLADALGLTTGSITAMLDRLEKLGYVERRPDPGDRRRIRQKNAGVQDEGVALPVRALRGGALLASSGTRARALLHSHGCLLGEPARLLRRPLVVGASGAAGLRGEHQHSSTLRPAGRFSRHDTPDPV